MRDWLALMLLRLFGKLAIVIGRLLPWDLDDEGKDKRTGSRFVMDNPLLLSAVIKYQDPAKGELLDGTGAHPHPDD